MASDVYQTLRSVSDTCPPDLLGPRSMSGLATSRKKPPSTSKREKLFSRLVEHQQRTGRDIEIHAVQ